MTIEKFAAQYMAEQETKQAKAEEIRAMEEQLQALKAEAEALAEDGDEAGYKKKKSEISDMEVRIFVAKKKAAKTICTPESAKEAWMEYAEKTYGPQIRKAKQSYYKSRAELAQQYEKLLLLENEALQKREILCAMTGAAAWTYTLPDGVEDKADPYPHNTQVRSPEVQFFTAAGIWTGDGASWPAVDTVNAIVRNKKHIADPCFKK